MGKSSTPSTQTVVNKTELPAWVTQAGQDIWGQTQAAAAAMPGPYLGNMIPGQSADTTAGYDMARGAATAAQPGLAAAAQGAASAAAYQPGQVQAGNFLSGNLGAYMNPYTQNVIDTSMKSLDDQRLQALGGVGDAAIAKNAFGGSRQGVMEGVTNAQSAQAAGQLSAQLNSQNFTQAQAAMAADQNRGLQAGLANQQAGLQGAQINNQGAIGLGNIAQAQQQSQLQGASTLLGSGSAQEQRDALGLQQTALQYETARNAPFDPITHELQAIGMIPYGQSSTTTGPATQQGQNYGMLGLGGALAGAQLGTALGLGGAGSGGLAGLGSLLGIFSDEREKTNKQKLGKDPNTGLDIYAYDYKSDVDAAKKSGKPMGPKRVGPMAQDIEKAAPGSTQQVGGKMVVASPAMPMGAMGLSGPVRRNMPHMNPRRKVA